MPRSQVLAVEMIKVYMSLCWIFVDDNSVFNSNIHHSVTSYDTWCQFLLTNHSWIWGICHEKFCTFLPLVLSNYVGELWQNRLLPAVLQSWIHSLRTLFLKPAHDVCLNCCSVSDYKIFKVMGSSWIEFNRTHLFFSEMIFASFKIAVSFCEVFLQIICA